MNPFLKMGTRNFAEKAKFNTTNNEFERHDSSETFARKLKKPVCGSSVNIKESKYCK